MREFVYRKDTGEVLSAVDKKDGDPLLRLSIADINRGLAIFRSETASLKTKRIDVDKPAKIIPTKSIIRPAIINKDEKRLVFVRTHESIGDLVSITSTIQAARKQRPTAKIIVKAPLPARSILENHPDIDELLDIDAKTDGRIIDLSHPCPCGEYETAMRAETDRSRNEIFTLTSGFHWEKERPKLYLSEEEKAFGCEFTNSILADYHVHIAEEDADFQPQNWVEVAKNKRLSIVGVNTHSNFEKSIQLTNILNKTSNDVGVCFVPVVEIEIADDTRKFHLLCVDVVDKVKDCRISEITNLRSKCKKLILAHPKYSFDDFSELLDGYEVENGRHSCKFRNNKLKEYHGSDAHRLVEWSNSQIATKVISWIEKTKIGVCLRTAETWKDWPYVEGFIELLNKHNYEVYTFDKSLKVDNAINVVGKTIREVMSILVYMDCVISPDTAIFHLCDALDVPCIALFGSLRSDLHASKYTSSVSFLQGKCKFDKPPCMYNICEGKGQFQSCMQFDPKIVFDKMEERIKYGVTGKD